jgi:small-conductance mechanosensitive channel
MGPQNFYQIRSEIYCAIARKFRQNGIEIPYPQRDLHVRSSLPIPFFSEDREKAEKRHSDSLPQ